MPGWLLFYLLCLWVLPVTAQNGTASLSGHLRDITGASIYGAGAELRSEKPPGRLFKAISDESGKYSFSNLAADEYTLKLQRAGFASLTLKAIQIGEGEEKTIPSLELSIGPGCGGYAIVDYLTLLPTTNGKGSLRGNVRLDQGLNKPLGRPIEGVDVALLCSVDSYCRKTKANSNGEFMFLDLPAGHYAISFRARSFYPLFLRDFFVEDGVESNYLPVGIEACPRGDCNPSRRPKRPLAVCE